VLAVFLKYLQATTIPEGLQVAFWVWLGFTATVQLSPVLWEGKPIKSWVLNTAYSLVSLLTAAVILTAW